MTALPQNARASSASLVASIAMLVHGALVLFGIAAWIRTPSIVSWRLLIAFLCMLASFGLSAGLWSSPSRKYATFGALTLLVSVLRLGLPSDWSNVTYGVLGLSGLLLMAVLRALFVLE